MVNGTMSSDEMPIWLIMSLSCDGVKVAPLEPPMVWAVENVTTASTSSWVYSSPFSSVIKAAAGDAFPLPFPAVRQFI